MLQQLNGYLLEYQGTRGTLETTKPWIDWQIWCKDW